MLDVEVSCLVELSDSTLASRRKLLICPERRGDRFAVGGDGAAGGGEGDGTAGGGCVVVGDRTKGCSGWSWWRDLRRTQCSCILVDCRLEEVNILRHVDELSVVLHQ